MGRCEMKSADDSFHSSIMVDWIHCNNCYEQLDGRRKFLLTNCRHIFCSECLTTDVCKICNVNCSTIVLSSHMKHDVAVFFTDPETLANKHAQELKKVITFQNEHRFRLINYMKQKLNNNRETQNECHKMTKYIKDLESAYRGLKESHQSLQQENAYLKKLVNQNSTLPAPSSTGLFSLMNNLGINTPNSSQTTPQHMEDNLNTIRTSTVNKNDSSVNHITPGRITIRTPLSATRRSFPTSNSTSSRVNRQDDKPLSESPYDSKKPKYLSASNTPVNSSRTPQNASSNVRTANYSDLGLLGKSHQRTTLRCTQNLISISNLKSFPDLYRRQT